MKRILSFVTAICVVFTMFTVGFVSANALTDIDGTDVAWNYDEETKSLTFSGEGAIPDYNSYLDENGEPSLKYPWAGLEYTSLAFSEGITGIGNYAFCMSPSLESVSIPSTVTSLGNGVFYKCEKLISADIEAPVEKISDEFFSYCTSLTSVKLPDTIKEIGFQSFYNCEKLEGITFTDSLEKIGEDAFSQCKELKSISFPKSLNEICDNAFSSCEKLENIELPDIKIGQSVFDECISLKSISFAQGTSEIPVAICSGCSALDTVTIPESVQIINDDAFYLCNSLLSVTVPSSTTSIGSNALGHGRRGSIVEGFVLSGYDNSAAEQYATDNEITFNSLGKALSGICGKDITWTYNTDNSVLTLSGSGPMYDYTSTGKPYYTSYEIISIDIANEITTIGSYAFYGLSSLTSFTVPDSSEIASIGDYSFTNCGFNSVTLKNNIQEIGEKAFGNFDDEGVLTGEYTISGYPDTAAYSYATANSITFIDLSPKGGNCGDDIVWKYDKENNTVILTGTGDMYDYASDNLPEYSFYSDASISIDDRITSIGDYAFYENSSEKIIVPPTVTSIGEMAIGYDGDTSNCTIIGFAGTAAQNYANDNSIKFESLGNYAGLTGKCGDDLTWTYSMSDLTLTITGNGAMFDSTSEAMPAYSSYKITSVVLPDTITSIGDYAFTGLAVTEYTIPQSVTEIGAFSLGFNIVSQTDENGELTGTLTYEKNDACTIKCYTDSAANVYAVDNNIAFILLDEKEDVIFADDKPMYINDNHIYFYENSVTKDVFLNNFILSEKHTYKISTETISTGTTLEIYNGEVLSATYTFIVNGDVDSNGLTNSADALLILLHTVSSSKLEGDKLKAADTNVDTKINSMDALDVLQITVGLRSQISYMPVKSKSDS